MSLLLSCDYKQLLANSLMSLVDFTSNYKLSVVCFIVKRAEDSQAAGTGDAAEGGFQQWAPSGVGWFTQGAENGNCTAALCKDSNICFFLCASENPDWPQTVTKQKFL